MTRSFLLLTLVCIILAGQAQASDFDDGLAARTRWEQYSNSLDSDQKTGALYWAGQRSLAHPGSCSGSRDFEAGCSSAQSMLTPYDQRRRSSPDFRRGWNTYQTSELVAAPFSPSSTVTYDPVSGRTPSGNGVSVPNYNPAASATPDAGSDQAWAAVLPNVRAKCATQYPDDYRMQAYCIKLQRGGFNELQALPQAPARPPPPSIAATPYRAPTPTQTSVSAPAPMPASLSGNAYGADSIARMVSIDRSNEFQFKRDYKGRLFAATGRFKSAADGLFGIGGRASFEAGNGQTFDCSLSNAQKNSLADWQTGKAVLVGGTISDTLFGDLILRDCEFSNP